jgi:RHH-type rel operon transcriptional repressor/antitoxin RelB
MSDVVSFRVGGDLRNRLSALAEQTRRTKAFYAREALELHLDDLEDYFTAAQISEQIAAGVEGVEDWNELSRELDARATANA